MLPSVCLLPALAVLDGAQLVPGVLDVLRDLPVSGYPRYLKKISTLIKIKQVIRKSLNYQVSAIIAILT